MAYAEPGPSAGRTEVRRTRNEDLAPIYEILKAAPEAAVWSQESLRATVEGDSHYCLTAWQDEAIVGFIGGRRVVDEGEILNLAVAAPFRRQGVGTTLVEALLNTFGREGVTRVFLEVRESNAGGAAFYSRLGFRRVGTRVNYYQQPDEAALVLAMDVSR